LGGLINQYRLKENGEGFILCGCLIAWARDVKSKKATAFLGGGKRAVEIKGGSIYGGKIWFTSHLLGEKC